MIPLILYVCISIWALFKLSPADAWLVGALGSFVVIPFVLIFPWPL